MSIVSTLRQADIFYEFTLTQLELIASICAEYTFAQGEIVFEENSDGSDLYVIADGEIDIQVRPAAVDKRGSTEPQTIARLRRGQSFGEMAMVDEGVRSARALAIQPDTRLIVIPRDKLMLLCDSYPHMGYRFMRNLAADLAMKIRNTDHKVREFLTWTNPHAT
ncbi:MAG: cyclic nucleotide-binding domain-containing protein [Anaerolineae bacterium]